MVHSGPPQWRGGPGGRTFRRLVIPGVVFSGGWEACYARVFSTMLADDRFWEFNMVHDYETVNSPGQGWIDGRPGPTVAGGLLFVGSGYVFGAGHGKPGNALLRYFPRSK